MSDDQDGGTRGGPADWRVGAKKARGASGLTVNIYEAVLDAGRPLSIDEVYERVKGRIDYQATREWWERRNDKSAGSNHFDLDRAGRWRVQERLASMARNRGKDGTTILRNANRGIFSLGDRAPSGWRAKPRDGFGWYEIDVEKKRADRERHRDTVTVLYEAREALANPKATAKRMRPLLAEAVRLLEAR